MNKLIFMCVFVPRDMCMSGLVHRADMNTPGGRRCDECFLRAAPCGLAVNKEQAIL